MQGQINIGTKPGDLIYEITSRENVKNIVEIGTWNGLGSTMCVIKSITDRKEEKNFISIELYPDMFEIAKINLNENLKYVKLLCGRIVDFDDVFWFNHSDLNFVSDGHARLYYETDMKFLKENQNVINHLPEKIDFLILDGGEYSTYPEWIKLKDRTKIVALDDTSILKTSKIRKEILESDEYVTIYDNLGDRNGFSVFEKK